MTHTDCRRLSHSADKISADEPGRTPEQTIRKESVGLAPRGITTTSDSNRRRLVERTCLRRSTRVSAEHCRPFLGNAIIERRGRPVISSKLERHSFAKWPYDCEFPMAIHLLARWNSPIRIQRRSPRPQPFLRSAGPALVQLCLCFVHPESTSTFPD